MSPDSPVLYDYWRSTASYRVRIALNLKGIAYRQEPVNLVLDGGQQHQAEYRALNPQGLVPVLVHDGQVLSQSLAICEYLEEQFPQPALLPADPALRARVRAVALTVACDIHPLNNLRVQQYLKSGHGQGGDAVGRWMNHWMTVGFAAIEETLVASDTTGLCCFGDEPGLADCFLIPQVYNADRFDSDMSPFPTIMNITRYCRALPQFSAAAPESQPDSQPIESTRRDARPENELGGSPPRGVQS